MSQNSDPLKGENSEADKIQEQSKNAADSTEPRQDSSAAPNSTENDQPSSDKHSSAPSGPTLIARYGQMKFLGEFRYRLEHKPLPGTKVVLRTERGVEMGDVLARICEEPAEGTDADSCDNCVKYGQLTRKYLEKSIKANDSSQSIKQGGKVLRVANNQDMIDSRHLEQASIDKKKRCTDLIKELSLDMQIVFVEHLLGGERIIFYFLADQRVDFRELVRKLAGEYRTRIEMRQVGARDEARLIADLERCGQHCCCQQYLKDLKPVSMRMAKTQKATLDPTKISGRCGRLMCCLRYEDKTYQQLKSQLPHRNIWVRTETLVGKVISTQILTQLVQIQLPDHSIAAIANEEILERNVPEPSKEEAAQIMARAAVASSARPVDLTPITDYKELDHLSDSTDQDEVEVEVETETETAQDNVLDSVELDPGWASLLGGGIVDSNKENSDAESDATTPSAQPDNGNQPQNEKSNGDEKNNKSHRRRGKRRRRRKK